MHQSVVDLTLSLAQHIYRLHHLLTRQHASGKLQHDGAALQWRSAPSGLLSCGQHAALKDSNIDGRCLLICKVHVHAFEDASSMHFNISRTHL